MTQEKLNDLILCEITREMDDEQKQVNELFNEKEIAKNNLLQRMWYSILKRLIGQFSVNIQIKRKGEVIFEYEIPKN